MGERISDEVLAMSKRIEELKQAVAAEQAARAAAERELDEYREGFHAAYEMYGAAVAIFKEQRRVLGVPEGDGVPITDHCADLVRRLGVAREALERIVKFPSDAYGLAQRALAALGPAPTPTTEAHR